MASSRSNKGMPAPSMILLLTLTHTTFLRGLPVFVLFPNATAAISLNSYYYIG
jgi:hypothetical protein